MVAPSADQDNFGVPRTPRRTHSTSKRSAFSLSHEKFSSPSSTPPRNLLLRNPPQTAKPETSYDSAPSKSLHFLPSLPVDTTTRSALCSLRHRSSASGLQSGRSTPALLNIAETIPEYTGLAVTTSSATSSSLKSTFRKIFGKSESARSESRAASRQSDRDPATSRSASRLDRSQTPNLFDISEREADLDNNFQDLTIRPAKSWTNLFRAKSPTPLEPSPPLPVTSMQEYFAMPMTPSNDQNNLISANEVLMSHHQRTSSQSEASTTDEQLPPSPRLRHSQGSISSYTARDQPGSPLMPDDVQAITTDTPHIMPHPVITTKKPLNFSLPRSQTSGRTVMELESYAARISNLEEDMANLQEKMLELEQQQLMVIQAQAADPDSAMYYKKSPPVLPQSSTKMTAYELTPPPSNFGRAGSNDDSAASSWLHDGSSDIDTTPSSRSTSPSPEHSTPTALSHHHDQPTQSDTPSLTSTSSPRQSQDSSASYFSPTAKVYKMFVDTKSDMDSLQLALDKLRADSPMKLQPLQTSNIRIIASTSSLKSPPLGSNLSDDEDPFISATKAQQQPLTSDCVFASTDRRRSYHRHSTIQFQNPASRSYQHVSSTTSHYHDALSAANTPDRSKSCRQQRRSSAVLGTATKARHVLGAQTFDSSENERSSNSFRQQKRSSAVIGTATKARQVLGAQAIGVGVLPVRGSSKKKDGW